MKKTLLFIVVATLSTYPVQAKISRSTSPVPVNISGRTSPLQANNPGEAPSPAFMSFLHTLVQSMEQGTLGTDGRVSETEDNVFVHFSIPQVHNNAAGVRMELRRLNGDLSAWVWQPRNDGSGLEDAMSCPIPPLPCAVVAEQARLDLTSPTELKVTFPKAQAPVEAVPVGPLS